jgi:hypothetical protein
MPHAPHLQVGAGLVHQVYGLVRQEAGGDVAVRKLRRHDEGAVSDLAIGGGAGVAVRVCWWGWGWG